MLSNFSAETVLPCLACTLRQCSYVVTFENIVARALFSLTLILKRATKLIFERNNVTELTQSTSETWQNCLSGEI